MSSIKKGRLGRALSLSRLGARMALGQGRRMLSSDPLQVHRQLALTLAAELGELKGLPMKIGQLLSYMEGVVPDEYRAAYQEVLAELRTHSEPMAWEVAAKVFEQELGAPPAQLLDSIDQSPIASASIGQVYRATHDGEPVCVKIQYPDIGEATLSDLQNLDGVIALMRTLMPNVDTRQVIDDFRARLQEECDYLQEADYQTRFARIYHDDPELLVPEVLQPLCSRRVLTTRRIDGTDFDTFARNASQAQRDRAGAALFRFAFGSLLQHGLFHADPHPGNLLLDCGPRGKLCMLDYGCVQPIDEPARRDIAVLLRTAMDGGQLLQPALRAMGVTQLDEASAAATVPILDKALEPLVAAQPYRFTRDYALDITRAVIDAKLKLGARYLTRRGRFVVERQGVMFVVRNLFGLASILGTLRAEGDFRGMAQRMLDEPGLRDAAPA